MKIVLQYDGPSTKGKSHVYKHADYGNVTVIVYVPVSGTQRPPLEIEIPQWWIDNTGPRS
jgi:hypothetical protein